MTGIKLRTTFCNKAEGKAFASRLGATSWNIPISVGRGRKEKEKIAHTHTNQKTIREVIDTKGKICINHWKGEFLND